MRIFLPFVFITVLFLNQKISAQSTITVHADCPGAMISPTQYGIFYEEIEHAGDGGLYAEMIQNRSFEEYRNGWEFDKLLNKGLFPMMDDSKNIEAWNLKGEGTMRLDQLKPLNDNNPTSLQITLNGETTLINAGFVTLQPSGGLNIKQDDGLGVGLACTAAEPLLFSFYSKGNQDFNGKFIAQLVGRDGKVIDSHSFSGINSEWGKYGATFIPQITDTKAHLEIKLSGKGIVWLDMVSLFPLNTFKNRSNGLRKDLAEMLEALKPAFIRFPGGCFVEGLYQLKDAWRPMKTLGDVANRPGLSGARWQYGSTDGLGYHEMLQLAEDIGAKPLLVVNIGMSHGDLAILRFDDPNAQMPGFLNDALDAIEYANGSISTKWGAIRAANGHPKPFNLQYIQLGNEQGEYPEYESHYATFYTKIKEKYPEMHIVVGSTFNPKGVPKKSPVEIVDEHYYTSTGWCIENFHKYDSYDRKGFKVYVGELGVTDDAAFEGNNSTNNLRTALGEAIFWLGAERNSDVVCMTSFAPLLCRLDQKMWSSNLIYFDQSRVFGSPSYYVLKLLSNNLGTVNLKTVTKSVRVILNTKKPGDEKDKGPGFRDYEFPESLYANSTIDSINNQIIIKVVNISPKIQKTNIILSGINMSGKNIELEYLANDNIIATNSLDNPLNVSQVTKKIKTSSKNLPYILLPANSFCILRIPVKMKIK